MSQRADKPDEAKINEYIERFVTIHNFPFHRLPLSNVKAHSAGSTIQIDILTISSSTDM